MSHSRWTVKEYCKVTTLDRPGWNFMDISKTWNSCFSEKWQWRKCLL